MSMPPATDQGPTLGGPGHSLGAQLFASLRDGIEAAFFWAAIVLPFLHVPILLAGPDTPTEAVTFLALLCLNAVAIVIGHAYQHE